MLLLFIFPLGSCPECSTTGWGPNGPPLDPHVLGPDGASWAITGRALAGPLRPLWAGPHVGPPGPLWAGPL